MNIYLTLDYELFMGAQSGSVQNCLIKPMNRLIERTKDYGVKFTLFVDAAYLYRLSELKDQHESLKEDYDDISDNLRSLVSQGHSVQLHIHPQWYYSEYKDGIWLIDQRHYKLSDMPADQLTSLFSNSKQLLEEIAGVKVNAFRAGGYSLQSLSDYANFLMTNGITSDSSVASAQRYVSEYQWYDYSIISGKRLYSFSADITKEDKEGGLKEYPIAHLCISTIRYILYRLYLKYFKSVGQAYGDGNAVPSNQSIKVFETKVMNYSFDYVMAPMLYSIFKKFLKDNCNDIVLIGHPKNQSPESIEELVKFIVKTRGVTSFKTIK